MAGMRGIILVAQGEIATATINAIGENVSVGLLRLVMITDHANGTFAKRV